DGAQLTLELVGAGPGSFQPPARGPELQRQGGGGLVVQAAQLLRRAELGGFEQGEVGPRLLERPIARVRSLLQVVEQRFETSPKSGEALVELPAHPALEWVVGATVRIALLLHRVELGEQALPLVIELLQPQAGELELLPRAAQPLGAH